MVWHKDFPLTYMIGRAYNTISLHSFYNCRGPIIANFEMSLNCLLYTSDAADE